MRSYEAQLTDRDLERIGHGAVCLGGWLEATHGVYGERAFEERGEAGIRKLLLDGSSGVGQAGRVNDFETTGFRI